MMTRESLYEWVIAHGCEVDFLEGVNASYNPNIRLYNPKTKEHALLATPIDDSVVSTFLVYRVCTLLGIEIPDCAVKHKPMMDDINDQLNSSR